MKPTCNIFHIGSTDDPRVEPYVGMRDRELARDGGRFIAEGEHLVRRLLASHYETESVLLAERRAAEIVPLVSSGTAIYVASTAVLNAIIGFKFHSGVLACGRQGPKKSLDDLLSKDAERLTLAICPDLNNVENLGSIIRVAAGFGVDALVLGEYSADPFFRRCVRVSMGTVFQLPIIQSDDLLRDLARLRKEWGLELIATVLDEEAESLGDAGRGSRLGLVFGNEAQGLSADIVAACDRRVTIPMRLGTDSLNVAVAAGIVLYHFSITKPDL